eukprot:1138526-Pelagomonas_calceolata.AAC.3
MIAIEVDTCGRVVSAGVPSPKKPRKSLVNADSCRDRRKEKQILKGSKLNTQKLKLENVIAPLGTIQAQKKELYKLLLQKRVANAVSLVKGQCHHQNLGQRSPGHPSQQLPLQESSTGRMSIRGKIRQDSTGLQLQAVYDLRLKQRKLQIQFMMTHACFCSDTVPRACAFIEVALEPQ